jgi:DNA polymerase III delta prime subunit
MATTAVGFVHFPLNIEIANAILSALREGFYADASIPWIHIDEVMNWVVATVNKVGKYSGWSTEHNYAHDRIDLYATAQVAQFLLDYRELRTMLVVRSAMDRAGLVPVSPTSVSTTWEDLQASDLEVQPAQQIKNKLRDKFVTPHQRSETPRSSSVLLYGPPGTSKTSIMEALANKLQWRFCQITPADFLSGGGEQVEARATLLFEILKRAKDVVLLFDEVDEFLLDRELKDRPQGIFRFMTTSMLPKLQSLKSQGRLIFGIATNYKERLDKAITRLGRVDYDWAVLPPDFTARIVLIKGFGESMGIDITPEEARDLAIKTPFFSFLELKKVVLERKRSGSAAAVPWSVVPHPTASPEVYSARPGYAEEFQTLLRTQIIDLAIALPEEIRTKLKGQLEDFQNAKRIEGSLAAGKTTIQLVAESIAKLSIKSE